MSTFSLNTSKESSIPREYGRSLFQKNVLAFWPVKHAMRYYLLHEHQEVNTV